MRHCGTSSFTLRGTLLVVLATVVALVLPVRGHAAAGDSVRGSGVAFVDGVRIQFAVNAATGGAGELAAGSLRLQFLDRGAPEIFRVTVGCLHVAGDYVIVGGTLSGGNGVATHVVLLAHDDENGDTFATIRFVDFAEGFDVCAFAEDVDEFLVFSPLERGGLVVTDG
jgi:hypothetical protein